jgi:hypothetical protein
VSAGKAAARAERDARLTRMRQRSARQAAEARLRRRHQILGRAQPSHRDPDRHGPAPITAAVVDEYARIVDRDERLVVDITATIAAAQAAPGGRPNHVSVRAALICFLVYIDRAKNFHLINLPHELNGLDPGTRFALGLDREAGDGTLAQAGYESFLSVFHRVADAFDAWADGLDDAARTRRADALQDLVDRLCAAANADAPAWLGNLVVDATLKWSWERPIDHGGKIDRHGKDGDAGKTLSLSDIVGPDPTDADFETLTAAEIAAAGSTRAARRRRRRPGTWGHGAAWAGRGERPTKAVRAAAAKAGKKAPGGKGVHKSVFGCAFHVAVRGDGPALIETFAVTPGPADPAASALPLLRRLHDRRLAELADSEAVTDDDAFSPFGTPTTLMAPLADVVADPAYTMNADRWHLPIKAMGGSPIWRMHRLNQDGPRWFVAGRGSKRRQLLAYGGRLHCECTPPALTGPFPTFPYHRGKLEAHWAKLAHLAAYEYVANGPANDQGSRQFLAPHRANTFGAARGGCAHCVHHDGRPVVDPDAGRPRPRCCTVPTITLTAAQLAYYQDEQHGSEPWFARWNVRNRVEGTFGITKNLAVLNWGRSFHQFVGLARETLVFAFVAVVHNRHMLRAWHAQQELLEAKAALAPEVAPDLPSASPTATRPAPAAVAEPRRRAPKGLPGIGATGPPG